MKLYLSFERALSQEQLDAVRALVQRRGRREPLQYITGSAAFCGLELAVNPHVLSPRPETELLAERAWKFLQESSGLPSAPAALDLGTGSGCLAIALAVNAPSAAVHATDACAQALALARENAARHHADHPVSSRRSFRGAPLPGAFPSHRLQSALHPDGAPGRARAGSARPRAAPGPGRRGGRIGFLPAHRRGSGRFPRSRTDASCWSWTTTARQAAAEIFRRQNWIVEAIEPDYNQRPRILIARRPTV